MLTVTLLIIAGWCFICVIHLKQLAGVRDQGGSHPLTCRKGSTNAENVQIFLIALCFRHLMKQLLNWIH